MKGLTIRADLLGHIDIEHDLLLVTVCFDKHLFPRVPMPCPLVCEHEQGQEKRRNQVNEVTPHVVMADDEVETRNTLTRRLAAALKRLRHTDPRRHVARVAKVEVGCFRWQMGESGPAMSGRWGCRMHAIRMEC